MNNIMEKIKSVTNNLTEEERELLERFIEQSHYDPDDLYDPHFLKLRFFIYLMKELENPISVGNYYTILKHYSKIEKFKNKDISTFSVPEFDSAIKSRVLPSYSSVAKDIAVLTRYVDYAMESGYIKTNVNPLIMNFRGKKIADYVSNTSLNILYYKEDEIWDAIKVLDDIQDRLFILLLFYIPAQADDLLCITKEDIDRDNNTVNILYVDANIRIKKRIPEKVMDLIVNTFNTHVYIGAGRNVTLKRDRFSHLFINRNGNMTKPAMYHRFVKLKQNHPEIYSMNFTNVYRSGIFNDLNKEINRRGYNKQEIEKLFSANDDFMVDYMKSLGLKQKQYQNFMTVIKRALISLYESGKYTINN